MLNRKPVNFTHNVRRRGTILILTTTICFALVAVVLVMARKMSVEATAAANQVAAIQADQVERGAEQYVMSMFNSALANGSTSFSVMDNTVYTEDYFAGIPVGVEFDNPTGWFWILRPQYDEDDLPIFGIVDETSKIDLNGFGNAGTATANTVPNATTYTDGMLMLPNMSDDVAASMYDWMDTENQQATNNVGMEDQYYLSLDPPYVAKNGKYTNVEELLMVYGFTPSYLFGDGTAGPLGELAGTTVNGQNTPEDPQLSRGVYDLLTTNGYGIPSAGGGGGAATTPVAGLINPNTAPRAVLDALIYSATEQDGSYGDQIIAYRQQNSDTTNPGLGDVTWFQQALSSIGVPNAGQLTNRVTGQPTRYSADILSVSRNGRGFKRVRLIIDTNGADGISTMVTAVSRRDMTDKGWPMDPAVLEYIRSNNNIPGTGVGGYASSGIR